LSRGLPQYSEHQDKATLPPAGGLDFRYTFDNGWRPA
jgi:hypothetical protein